MIINLNRHVLSIRVITLIVMLYWIVAHASRPCRLGQRAYFELFDALIGGFKTFWNLHRSWFFSFHNFHEIFCFAEVVWLGKNKITTTKFKTIQNVPQTKGNSFKTNLNCLQMLIKITQNIAKTSYDEVSSSIDMIFIPMKLISLPWLVTFNQNFRENNECAD